MAKVVQLLSVIGGSKVATDQRMEQLQHAAAQPGLFDGHDRTYQKRFDDGADLPAEPKKVRATAAEVLRVARQLLVRHWDLSLTVDAANALGKADVTVDGEVLLREVPVGHLLWLAKEVERVQKLVRALPVLDSARNWQDSALPDISKADPVGQAQREKTPYNWHRENGTDKFQEIVDVMFRDDVIGTWTVTQLSGALDPRRKEQLLERLGKLADALKMAREEANTAVAQDRAEGDVLFDYILAP
jgi:hypothetical protein